MNLICLLLLNLTNQLLLNNTYGLLKEDNDTFRWSNGDDLNVTNWDNKQPDRKFPDEKCTLVVPGKGWDDYECKNGGDSKIKFLPLCERAVSSGKIYL